MVLVTRRENEWKIVVDFYGWPFKAPLNGRPSTLITPIQASYERPFITLKMVFEPSIERKIYLWTSIQRKKQALQKSVIFVHYYFVWNNEISAHLRGVFLTKNSLFRGIKTLLVENLLLECFFECENICFQVPKMEVFTLLNT